MSRAVLRLTASYCIWRIYYSHDFCELITMPLPDFCRTACRQSTIFLVVPCSGDPGASPVPVPPGPAPRGDGVHAVRVRLRPPQPLLGLAGGQSRSPPRHTHWLAAPLHRPQSGESRGNERAFILMLSGFFCDRQ
jgi:hypothetical protein